MRDLLKKIFNRETISYLIFGVLTTAVNYLVFWLIIEPFGDDAALWANVVAFVAALIFSYVTNKLFVFESKSWNWEVLKKELPSFVGARILSFLFDETGLLVCVKWLQVGRFQLFGISGLMIAKLFLSVVVVIVNYVLSKFFIFKPSDKN